jgi:hypothetical protein
MRDIRSFNSPQIMAAYSGVLLAVRVRGYWLGSGPHFRNALIREYCLKICGGSLG